MRQQRIYGFHVLLIAAASSLLCLGPFPAAAKEIIVDRNSASCRASAVPPCYPTIQTAINNALTGDSIMVEPGIYPEQITLPNPNATIASISGRVTAATILTGGGSTILTVGAGANTTIRNFTFANAVRGVQIANGAALTVTGNVFYNLSESAIFVDDAASSITNNTFRGNTTAVSSSVNVSLKNNIFSGNTNALVPRLSVPLTAVSYCAFHNNANNGITVDPSSTTSTNIPNSTHQLPADPLFVNPNIAPPGLDLHLRSTSPCINAGSDTNRVNPPAPAPASHDMGAYGGGNSDNVPFAVAGLASSATTTTSVSLSWSANPDYLVQGYRVYYGYSPGVYSGTDAVVSGATATSPIDAHNVTSFLISGLTRTATPLSAAPVLTSVAPGNGQLSLSWVGVPGATAYNIHYQEIYPTTGPVLQTGAVSGATNYTLTGLTNGVWYAVQVSAVAQAAYYFSVTSYYQVSGAVPGIAWESAYSPEQVIYAGPSLEGPLSNQMQGAPDAIIPAPDLKNTGCFIATAAYDSADAPPVRALRNFRDRYLVTNAVGRAFVRWYYRTSPAIAARLNAHPALKPLARAALQPAVAVAYAATTAPGALAFLLLAFPAAAAVVALRRRRARTLPVPEDRTA